jgi:hypothetical protein
MKRRVLIPFVLALLLIAALAPAAFAAPLFDTIIESNEVVNNDVIVFDGDLEIHAGAVVNGDVAVFNGDAFIDGEINGSLTLFNGDLEAGPGAAISGECVLLNGETTVEGARDRSFGNCTAVQNLELGELAPWLGEFQRLPELEFPEQLPPLPTMPAMPTLPAMPEMPAIPAEPEMPAIPAAPEQPVVPPVPAPENTFRNMTARFAGVLASSVLFSLLGLLVGAIMPTQLRQIVTTARDKTVVSGMAGVLTAVAVPSLIILLIPVSLLLTLICIGLLGFPIMFLLALGLFVGSFLGWVAAGTWLGLRFFGGKDGRIVRSAALGTGLLTLLMGLLGLVTPFGFIEGLLSFLIVCTGLGAVALTQFGMKPYPRRPQAGPGDNLSAGKVETVLNTLPPEEKIA